MRSVWSFWTPPFQARKGRVWRKPLHHFLAWGISLSAARRHYPETVLVTDQAGKKLLIDALVGLQFTAVSTELDCLRTVDPDWWALGKLVAYSIQDQPFIHLDTDVFLWKPSSTRCGRGAGVCAVPGIFSPQRRPRAPRHRRRIFDVRCGPARRVGVGGFAGRHTDSGGKLRHRRRMPRRLPASLRANRVRSGHAAGVRPGLGVHEQQIATWP